MRGIKGRLVVFAALVRSIQDRPGFVGFSKAVIFAAGSVLGLRRSAIRYRPYVPQTDQQLEAIAAKFGIDYVPRRPVTDDEVLQFYGIFEEVCGEDRFLPHERAGAI
jgi:hypothetical protein